MSLRLGHGIGCESSHYSVGIALRGRQHFIEEATPTEFENSAREQFGISRAIEPVGDPSGGLHQVEGELRQELVAHSLAGMRLQGRTERVRVLDELLESHLVRREFNALAFR